MMRFDKRYDDYGYERDDEGYEEQINEYLTPREVMELLAIGKNTFYIFEARGMQDCQNTRSS